MKTKTTLLIIAATLGMNALTMAQNVPNYVPTNGLVGWWPFNGNANDESGNGNNGTVNGATLTQDRFGSSNAAYLFTNNGTVQNIQTNYAGVLGQNNRTISLWYRQDVISTIEQQVLCGYGGGLQASAFGPTTLSGRIGLDVNNIRRHYSLSIPNQWNHAVFVYETGNSISTVKVYLNGVLQTTAALTYGNQNTILNTIAGLNFRINAGILQQIFIGSIDDIGFWNRALTQQEITALFNAVNCANNTAITPLTDSLTPGSTATFTASTSDPYPSYFWQSNFGQGFQTLIDIENYSGTNTSTLNISNVQLSEHNQPIRVITTSGECIDTSDIAIISIIDTCITSINDTTFITVTDTLVINTLITVVNLPYNSNTIKVYPNPANSHITIDYGDFAIMNGYQLRIENSLGQQVFQTDITQQSDYLTLNTWGGNGIYFVHIVDPQGDTIDIRKIVLQ